MGRKCIIKDKGYNSYSTGIATYQSSVGAAKIYDYDELEDWQKNDPDTEVIFLDSEKGFKLLVEEIEGLEISIAHQEYRLRIDKENYEKIRNAIPEMTDEYIRRHNKRYHPLIGISENEKAHIRTQIIEEHET